MAKKKRKVLYKNNKSDLERVNVILQTSQLDWIDNEVTRLRGMGFREVNRSVLVRDAVIHYRADYAELSRWTSP